MSNDTVMIRLQKDTYGRDFNLESGVWQQSQSVPRPKWHKTMMKMKQSIAVAEAACSRPLR